MTLKIQGLAIDVACIGDIGRAKWLVAHAARVTQAENALMAVATDPAEAVARAKREAETSRLTYLECLRREQRRLLDSPPVLT